MFFITGQIRSANPREYYHQSNKYPRRNEKKYNYIIYNEINLQEGSAMLLYFPIHFSQ